MARWYQSVVPCNGLFAIWVGGPALTPDIGHSSVLHYRVTKRDSRSTSTQILFKPSAKGSHWPFKRSHDWRFCIPVSKRALISCITWINRLDFFNEVITFDLLCESTFFEALGNWGFRRPKYNLCRRRCYMVRGGGRKVGPPGGLKGVPPGGLKGVPLAGGLIGVDGKETGSLMGKNAICGAFDARHMSLRRTLSKLSFFWLSESSILTRVCISSTFPSSRADTSVWASEEEKFESTRSVTGFRTVLMSTPSRLMSSNSVSSRTCWDWKRNCRSREETFTWPLSVRMSFCWSIWADGLLPLFSSLSISCLTACTMVWAPCVRRAVSCETRDSIGPMDLTKRSMLSMYASPRLLA